MKTATIRSVRVEPACAPKSRRFSPTGESLSEFVEASVQAGVERRRVRQAFIERGLRSRDKARRTDDYVDGDVALDGLQRKLDAARVRPASTDR